jgi:hypothetical protein
VKVKRVRVEEAITMVLKVIVLCFERIVFQKSIMLGKVFLVE